VKRAFWVAVAFGIAAAGAWVYAGLARQENDDGRRVRLLAIAEEQRLDLSLTRSGRLVTRVPEEGELVKAGDTVARIEEPGLAEDASDLERQRESVLARDRSRLEDIVRLQADMAQIASEEKRIGRLVSEGIAASADLETLQHRRDAAAAGIRAHENEKGQLEAEDRSLQSRLEKVRRFEREGTLTAAAGGTVLTRHHREGEFVAAGNPVVTLQVEAPYLRVEVPEERLSSFSVGSTVSAWPQARPDARFSAKVVSVKPRSEFATRRNWGLQSRDLRTFSVRLQPADVKVVSGQTFVVEAGKS
jgi:HlyD family secretion protein